MKAPLTFLGLGVASVLLTSYMVTRGYSPTSYLLANIALGIGLGLISGRWIDEA